MQSLIPGTRTRIFLLGAVIFAGLLIAARYDYLLFHSLAETFSVVVACAIFMVAWNSRPVLEKDYILFLGIAYLFVGGLDFTHMLAYKGMGVFPGYNGNLATQLWISARYVESISLAIAPLFLTRHLKGGAAFVAYAGITTLLLLATFHWHVFPDCFVEGTGLTPFKKISEYVISLIFLTAGAVLVRKRKAFDRDVFQFLILSIFASIGAELSFTLYTDVYGLSNLAGHFLKIVSFALIYKAVIETGLVRPHAVLFRNLKQSEQTLRESEAFAKSVLDSSLNGLYIYDLETGLNRFVNSRYTHLTGYSLEDLQSMSGREFSALFHPEDRERVSDHMKRMLHAADDEAREIEYRFKTAEGRWIWCVSRDVAFARRPDGSRGQMLGAFLDITERKESEEHLLESEGRFRQIAETINHVFWMMELDPARLLYVSPAFERIWGRTAEDLYQNPRLWVESIHPEDSPRVKQAFEAWLSDPDRDEYHVEYRIVRTHGEICWISDRGTVVRNAGGEVYRVCGIAEDITLQKQAEEELRRSRDELELKVQERTEQLQKYAARLEWRNRELEDFAYVASHDLQEPLRKVQMFGDMLELEAEDTLSDKSMDYLRRMIKSARRMQALVKDLLDYSRVSMKSEPFGMTDLNEALGQALGNLEATVRQLQARIDVKDLPRIEADSSQMIQLFQNLVGNALKFCPDGQAPVIEIYSEGSETSPDRGNGFCSICIKDNGIGFDEHYLAQIFRPFERLHGRHEYEGTGIGLAICKKIVERHGGRITARSAPGKGATFIVTLPAVQEGSSVSELQVYPPA